ncbi:FHA domain-containing protein [bacterium]|nr:FHA domain-containing protein [bacterium]
MESVEISLILQNGTGAGKEFPLRQGTNLVGRWDRETGSFPEVDLDEVDVDAKISRKHAVIRCSLDSMLVRDLGSLNGTFLNRSEQLDPERDYPLSGGDELIVGNLIFAVRHNKNG